MISRNSKKRIQDLAGIIINENVSLIPSPEGRSGPNTLSWFVEQYIINMAEEIISQVDKKSSTIGNKLAISQGKTKMQENSFSTILISGNEEILFTILVNFNQDASTSVSFNDEQFILKSHHSASDLNSFIMQIIERLSDLIHIINI